MRLEKWYSLHEYLFTYLEISRLILVFVLASSCTHGVFPKKRCSWSFSIFCHLFLSPTTGLLLVVRRLAANSSNCTLAVLRLATLKVSCRAICRDGIWKNTIFSWTPYIYLTTYSLQPSLEWRVMVIGKRVLWMNGKRGIVGERGGEGVKDKRIVFFSYCPAFATHHNGRRQKE